MNPESDTPDSRTRKQQIEDHLKTIQQGFDDAYRTALETKRQMYRRAYDALAAGKPIPRPQ